MNDIPLNDEEATRIADAYWVEPGRLMAGEYPGATDVQEARLKLRWLLQQGIDVWVDLTEAGESGLKPYAGLLHGEAAALGRTVEHRRLAIPDLGTVSDAAMQHILDGIDAALASGHRVYVHCWGGVGRTGTVVGCLLRRRGLGYEEALEHISELRAATPKRWRQSPETSEQRRQIERWCDRL